MQLSVLYFAALRDLMGKSEEVVELPAGASVGSLSELLQARLPELTGFMSSVRFALNEEFTSSEAKLKDGDVVALIPPVQGG